MRLLVALLALSLLLTPLTPSPAGEAKSPAAPVVQPAVLEVLFPPPPSRRDFEDVQTYLLSKSSPAFPLISGAVIQVDWSDFDIGDAATGTHTKYDFKIVDDLIAPWISAGKYANLVLHSTPYGGRQCPPTGSGSNGRDGVGNCAMPPWMWTALGESDVTTCDGAQTANFMSSVYMKNYQAAMAELIKHYASNPGVGYIRVGLGKGGEINLPRGWHDTGEPCGHAYVNRWGYTVGDSSKYTWNAYLEKMLDFEGSLHAAKQLMVSITPVQAPGHNPQEVSDFLAPIAVKYGIGFGNQGLATMAMRDCTGMQADWCALFERFQGKVPLEMQTLGKSCPQGPPCDSGQGFGQGHGQGQNGGWRPGGWQGQGQGGWGQNQGGGQGNGRWQGRPGGAAGMTPGNLAGMTGSLVPLLPFAIKNHTTILEIYCDDWLLAFSPNHPQHSHYGADYAQALKDAAGK
jgi:hypothetical protein